MKNKSILILASPLPENFSIEEYDLLIPLTLLSYHELDSRGQSTTAPDSLYSRDEHKENIATFNRDLRKLLFSLDQEAQDNSLGRNRYSLNGFWIFHRLQDLYYIYRLTLAIIDQASEVTLLSSFNPAKVESIEVNWSTLRFQSFGGGAQHVVTWVDYFLRKNKVKYSFRSCNSGLNAKNKYGSPLKNLITRLPKILKHRGLRYFKSIQAYLTPKSKLFWKIQSGYEVRSLEELLPRIEFSSPPQLKSPKKQGNKNKKKSLVEQFLDSHFLECREILMNFFHDYSSQIVNTAPEIKATIVNQLLQYKPDALLYSSGATTLREALYAEAAEENNIKVAYFKHCGIENLFLNTSYLDNYFEKNPLIPRVHFTHSALESEEIAIPPHVRTFPIFPLENYFYPTKKKSKGILYSMGPSSTWSLKDIQKITLDSERYSFIKALLEFSKTSSSPIHIKVHPADWNESRFFLSKYLGRAEYNIKLIVGGSIEKVIDNYEVIVLDMISTKVLTAALRAKKNIVLFKPKGIEVNSKTYPYLQKRVNIVTCPTQLNESIFRSSIKENELKEFENFFFPKIDKKNSLKLILKELEQEKDII